MNAFGRWRRLAGLFLALCLAALVVPVAAQQPQPLLVHSATDTAAMAPLIAAFEARNPGIEVIYTEFNTNELYAAALAALSDPRTPAEAVPDVVISPASDLQVKLVNAGLAHAFTPSGAADLPAWARWRRELYGFTYEPAAVIYNRAAFSDRALPRTHSELAGRLRDEAELFDGRVGTYDIRRSGIGYLYATQDAIQGFQTFRLTESLGRARARTYCCTAEMAAEVAEGALLLAYNAIGSYALDAAATDPRLGVLFLEDYTLVMTRSAFVTAASPRKAAATAFVDFLLSPAGQAEIAERSALLPLAPSARRAALPASEPAQSVFLPIKLGPGLLTYLDRLKHQGFLESWEASLRPPPAWQLP